jgi:glycosyltransferase involved in cell wall biosynthesis
VVLDLIPLLFPKTYLTTRLPWAVMYLISTGISIFRADEIVAISERTAGDLYRFSHRRATVLYPPIPQRVVTARRPSPVGLPYVIYNGGFDSRKNVPQLLDAFGVFRGTPEGFGSLLVVLGDREDMANAMLRKRGLAESSLVTGFVSEEEKWDYLVNALAVLYPSSYEGFGLVAVEAFAAGVPVISGTGGALREVGGDGAIFIDPTSVSSIVQGLRSACDPVVRAQAVALGYDQLEILRRRSGGYARLLGSLRRVGLGKDRQRGRRISW